MTSTAAAKTRLRIPRPIEKKPEPLDGQPEEIARLVWFLQAGTATPSDFDFVVQAAHDNLQFRAVLIERVSAILAEADRAGFGEKLRQLIAELP